MSQLGANLVQSVERWHVDSLKEFEPVIIGYGPRTRDRPVYEPQTPLDQYFR